MKAKISNLRLAPRKMRLVANLVKGKTVPRALAELKFLTKRGAKPLTKLINSAVAAAKPALPDSLTVRDVRVDQGATLKRMRPRARGRSARINKRVSQVSVFLGL